MTSKINICAGIILLTLLSVGPALSAVAEKSATSSEVRISSVEQTVKTLAERVEEVRRDQLNYKVEKDLLKEAYSSSVESINVSITVVLAALAIFGYLGVRGIGTLKADFHKELDELRTIRKEFEGKIAGLDKQLSDANSRFEEMTRVNIDQDRRLQVLEIQEKCGTLMNQNNFARALEYANIGLGISNKDSVLLGVKAVCLMKMGSISDAFETFKVQASVSPENVTIFANLVELGAILGKAEEASILLAANQAQFVNAYGPYLPWYLRAIILYYGAEPAKLKEHLRSLAAPTDEDKARRIAKIWAFDEALAALGKDVSRAETESIRKVIEFLEGRLGYSEFIASL